MSESVQVESPYCHFELRSLTSTEGKREQWFNLRTRPAFEVAFYNPAKNSVILMAKRRIEAEPERIKCPGGYLFDKPDENHVAEIVERMLNKQPITKEHLEPLAGAMEQKLSSYGIETSFLAFELLGCVVGHSEILLPIFLFVSRSWVLRTPPSEVRLFEVPLASALKMARNAIRNGRDVGHALENDSSVELLFSLHLDLAQA